LKDEEGAAALREYYEPYIELARESGMGFIYGTPTWRASPDWGEQIGYSLEQLDEMNRAGVALGRELRAQAGEVDIVISGVIGPQGDGYSPDTLMTAAEAQEYHAWQIGVFADAGVDAVDALTMTYPAEAIGVVKAASEVSLPVGISFTLETDGRLPNGDSLTDAIGEVEKATDGSAAYFMVNCAHPTHFDAALGELPDEARQRICGVRANASTMSHAELDEAEELDDGDPRDLGERYVALRSELPNMRVLGGCCGTDLRHVRAIRDAWVASA
jgi:homocysteine S-methyltransferase